MFKCSSATPLMRITHNSTCSKCYNISLLQYFNASMFQCSNVQMFQRHSSDENYAAVFYWNTVPVIFLHVFLLQFSPFIVSILVLLYRSDHTYTANNEWEKISISFPIHYSKTGHFVWKREFCDCFEIMRMSFLFQPSAAYVYVWVQLGESQTLNQM